ncbi:MAG TPA: phosphopantetheine-binding protein [Candidatus Paceibacterota bacterium]
MGKKAYPKPEFWKPDEVWSWITNIVAEQACNIISADIKPETQLGPEGLNLDSLDSVELIMELDDCFDVSISDEVAPKLQTVGEVEKWITEQLREQGRLAKQR